jgi:hypothetical protein
MTSIEQIFPSLKEKLRRLYKEEIYALSSSPNIFRVIKSRRMIWAKYVARTAKRFACRILMGKPDGRRTLGNPTRRWEDNIKIDLQEVGWWIDWINVANDRDMWLAVVNAGKTLE